jgi:RNA-directed DNA polymerase
MKRVRARVEELTRSRRGHEDIRRVIADLNPVLRGWGNYFPTGNAAKKFNQLDACVWRRWRDLRIERKGRHRRPGEVAGWTDAIRTHGLNGGLDSLSVVGGG